VIDIFAIRDRQDGKMKNENCEYPTIAPNPVITTNEQGEKNDPPKQNNNNKTF